MAKVVGIDLGTTNSVVAVMEGHAARPSFANAEGIAHDAVGRGIHQDRRTARRATRETPSRHQSRPHDLLDQAAHGRRDHHVKIDGKDYTPQEICAMILQKLVNDASTYLGERVTKAVITVPGVLQRRAAASDQRRRQDRRPRRAAHHQRADGGSAGVRSRQKGQRDDPRVGPRRRHVRRVDPRSRRRRLRSEVDQRRHAPRRRRLRPAHRRLARRPSSARIKASISATTSRRCSA